ncbi:AraC family transcriptional regulator [Celeribacter halophilus]|uniref:helix-turn-helix transcriptional regulator n=1 Tax=Celeribacter halophilus TaxID=576117 RepID=UPI0026E3A653|nr:AraC family transcriptional regulator [Celeribacter halophilus]MDO6725218.1 AraC family transcriptional regulator [Celeribacter halophilus]
MKDNYAIMQHEPAALHDRSVRVRHPESHSTLLFLEQGHLSADDPELAIDAPALCFWPAGQRPSLRLAAGASAFAIGLSDTIVLDAVGARAESVHLRMLTETPFLTPLSDIGAHEQVETLMHWFVSEMTEPERQSPMSLAAYLRLILICALRLYKPDPSEKGGELTSILREFRHLVELHYRDHWPVSRYADTLGVNYDRLQRMCKRETGRSPGDLVHERLTAEAKARLENTGVPLKKIAADLGFPDATRFSHFFKRRTDMAPGAYRAIVSRPDGEELHELRSGFSDWP